MKFLGSATQLGILDLIAVGIGLLGCLCCAIHHFFFRDRSRSILFENLGFKWSCKARNKKEISEK